MKKRVKKALSLYKIQQEKVESLLKMPAKKARSLLKKKASKMKSLAEKMNRVKSLSKHTNEILLSIIIPNFEQKKPATWGFWGFGVLGFWGGV